MKTLITMLLTVALVASMPLMARPGPGWGAPNDGQQVTQHLPLSEEQHLTFMREEEKLARDVYITFSQMYPRSRVFGRIDNSEQQHTDAIKRLLDKYGVVDPSTNDNVGIFTGYEYGEYFTNLFKLLIEVDNQLEALYVSAYIEEFDIIDLLYCNQEIIYANDELTDRYSCGLEVTETTDVQRTLNSLLMGARSHLRAYVRDIEREIGVGNYAAQLLTQEEVDEILGR